MCVWLGYAQNQLDNADGVDIVVVSTRDDHPGDDDDDDRSG